MPSHWANTISESKDSLLHSLGTWRLELRCSWSISTSTQLWSGTETLQKPVGCKYTLQPHEFEVNRPSKFHMTGCTSGGKRTLAEPTMSEHSAYSALPIAECLSRMILDHRSPDYTSLREFVASLMRWQVSRQGSCSRTSRDHEMSNRLESAHNIVIHFLSLSRVWLVDHKRLKDLQFELIDRFQ